MALGAAPVVAGARVVLGEALGTQLMVVAQNEQGVLAARALRVLGPYESFQRRHVYANAAIITKQGRHGRHALASALAKLMIPQRCTYKCDGGTLPPRADA